MVYAREERLHIRHVTAEHYSLQPVSNTFHGRDIFAPIAAWLAKGVDSEKFGEEITDFVRFNPPKPKSVDGNSLRGVVLKVDRFGNLVTNITPQDAPMLFGVEPAPFRIYPSANMRLPRSTRTTPTELRERFSGYWAAWAIWKSLPIVALRPRLLEPEKAVRF